MSIFSVLSLKVKSRNKNIIFSFFSFLTLLSLVRVSLSAQCNVTSTEQPLSNSYQVSQINSGGEILAYKVTLDAFYMSTTLGYLYKIFKNMTLSFAKDYGWSLNAFELTPNGQFILGSIIDDSTNETRLFRASTNDGTLDLVKTDNTTNFNYYYFKVFDEFFLTSSEKGHFIFGNSTSMGQINSGTFSNRFIGQIEFFNSTNLHVLFTLNDRTLV